MHSLKVSVTSRPKGTMLVLLMLMAAPLGWSAPAFNKEHMNKNPNVVYERYVRRRPELGQFNQEVFEVREIYYRPTPKIRLLDDDEMDSIIRCDFDPTLIECENLNKQRDGIAVKTSTSLPNWNVVVETTTNQPLVPTTTPITTTTTTTTTTTDWPHLPELSEEEILAEDQDVEEIEDNAIDGEDNNNNDDDDDDDDDNNDNDYEVNNEQEALLENNGNQIENKPDEILINEDLLEENNIGNLVRTQTVSPDLSEGLFDQDAIDAEDLIETNSVGKTEETFDVNGNEKNENDDEEEINDDIDNDIIADYRSEEDGIMGFLDLTNQRK